MVGIDYHASGTVTSECSIRQQCEMQRFLFLVIMICIPCRSTAQIRISWPSRPAPYGLAINLNEYENDEEQSYLVYLETYRSQTEDYRTSIESYRIALEHTRRKIELLKATDDTNASFHDNY